MLLTKSRNKKIKINVIYVVNQAISKMIMNFEFPNKKLY